MAIEPRRTEISREQVAKWIVAYKTRTADFKATNTLEDFIRGKIASMNLPDDKVLTTGHDDLRDVTPIADMILADLPSYL